MIPKWLYYLLNVTAYPLAIYLAIWLSNNVRYDPQGMACLLYTSDAADEL